MRGTFKQRTCNGVAPPAIIILGIAVAMLSNAAVLWGQVFSPQWQIGQSWSVQTLYYHAQDMSQEPGQSITQWHYQVIDQDGENFVVQIQNQDDPENMVQMWVNQQTMTLQQQTWQFQAQGQTQTMQGQYPGQGMVPQCSQVGPCGCELPLFPLGEQAEQRYMRDLNGFEGEVFQVEISQQEQWIDSHGDILEYLAQFPDTNQGPVQDAPFYYIVESSMGESRVRQVWAQEMPWYLVSINDNSISWLVEF